MKYFVLISIFQVVLMRRNLLNPCDPPQIINGTIFASIIESYFTDYVPIPINWLNQSLVYINCSSRGLKIIPTEIPPTAQVIDLSKNMIRNISQNSFQKWKHLQILFLTSNCYTGIENFENPPPCSSTDFLDIHSNAFLNLPQLRWLGIDSNRLKILPNLPSKLKILDISATLLGNITDQLISSNFSDLDVFLGGYNCLQRPAKAACPRNYSISSNFSPNLQTLDMSANSLTKIPTHLFNERLKFFRLSFNILDGLFKNDFVKAPFIEVLILSSISDYYCTVPHLHIDKEVFSPLQSLRYLDLSDSLIEFIPDGIFEMNKNLEYIDLSLSSMHKIVLNPTFLSGLANLRYLDLSSSDICHPANYTIEVLKLGDAFSTLTSLETLMLGTPPSVYPSTIPTRDEFCLIVRKVNDSSFVNLEKLFKLKEISLSGLHLKTIGVNTWQQLKTMKSIYLARNIISFNEKTFDSLESTKLKFNSKKRPKYKFDIFTFLSLKRASIAISESVLDYSNNNIESINDSYIVKSVSWLDLSYNQIHQIRKNDLCHFVNLEVLILSHNEVSQIHEMAFLNLRNLKYLEILSSKVIKPQIKFLANLSPFSKVEVKWATFENIYLYDVLQRYVENNNKTFDSVDKVDLSRNEILAPLYTKSVNAFRPFKNAKHFILNKCLIKNLPPNFFSGLRKLTFLSMQKNKISNIPLDALKLLPNLEKLYLDENCLTSLNFTNFFVYFPNITTFSVSRNSIQLITAGFFNGSRLEHIDLSFNRIFTVDPFLLQPVVLNFVHYLDFRWNNLDCSCDIWDSFFLWYSSDQSLSTKLPGLFPTCSPNIDMYFQGCVACRYPKQLQGYSISRFGFNSSCDVTKLLYFTIGYSSLFMIFLIAGTVGYSSWIKRNIFRKINQQFRVRSLNQKEGNKSLKMAKRSNKVFVFYDLSNNEVGSWVDYQLAPKLEAGDHLILLNIFGRDTACGMSPTEQLLNQILESRKTIILLTEHFCESPKFKFVMNALREIEFSHGNDHLILITWYGANSPRVPLLVQKTFNRKVGSFLKFDSAIDDEELFVETVRTEIFRN